MTGNPSTGYNWVYTLTDNTIDHPNPNSTGTDEGIFDQFTSRSWTPTATRFRNLKIGFSTTARSLTVTADAGAAAALAMELDETVGPDRYNAASTRSRTPAATPTRTMGSAWRG